MTNWKEKNIKLYNNRLIEAKPLFDKVKSLGNIDTEHFTIKVVYKEPHKRIDMLYHDWTKIIEGSLNHEDIKEKVWKYVNANLEANCLHSDFLANAKWVNEKYCDNEINIEE